MADKDKDEKILEEARKQFQRCQESEADNRERYDSDIRFGRLGEQWPEQTKKLRNDEQRPCLTLNRIPAFVRQMVNDARQNKPSIKCSPVDDKADIETAEILNGVIRNIEIQSSADEAYDTAIDCAASGGFGYFRIDRERSTSDVFGWDIKIARVSNPLTIYGDPRSIAATSVDWDVAFITELMTHDEFEAEYGEKIDKINWESDYRDIGDNVWFDDKNVRVAEYWKRETVNKTVLKLNTGEIVDKDAFEENADLYAVQGVQIVDTVETPIKKVMQYVLSGADVLEANEWPGTYIPIIPVYGEEVVVDGERHFFSLFHHAKGAQENLNYWRTAATELVALAPKVPYIGPEGAFDADPRWSTANSKSHAYLEYAGGISPQRQPMSDLPIGALQEAANASEDMKSIIGLYDASLGARSNETSGRAIMARQMEGDTSTFHFIDNMNRAIEHAGRVLVDLIPHIYSEERVLRVLGEDGTPDNVPVNQPVPMTDENGQPQMQQAQGPMGEVVEVPVTRIYDLANGKYDVTVKAGPSFNSRREEASNQMMELLRVFPMAAPVIGDLLAENLDWPHADEIAKRLKAMLPPGVKDEDPEKKAMMQQIEQLMTTIKALQGELGAAKQDQQTNQFEAQTDRFEAETDRMEAETERAQAAREAITPSVMPGPPTYY